MLGRGRTTRSAPAATWTGQGDLPSWHPSEVLPGLSMGGSVPRREGGGRSRPADLEVRGFDAVVTLHAEAPPVDVHVEELRYCFADGAMSVIDVARLLRTACWAEARWQAGDRVLIRCQAGLNRSGLVTCLVLMLQGRSAAEAIADVRDRRSPHALCNQAFVQWLHHDAGPAIAALDRRSMRTGDHLIG